MQPFNPNYNWETGVKQIKITEENLSQSCILCQLVKAKTLTPGSKYIKHFFFYLYCYLPYISWVDVIYLTWLVFLKSPWWFVWIFCAPTPLRKITKKEHRKIFCDPSKILKNISWTINICLKYFMIPTKTLRPTPAPSPALLHT